MGMPIRTAQIRGYPDYTIYEDGRVYSHKTNRFLKYNTKTSGYPTVELFNNEGSKRLTVHRLVADAFIPNPNGFPQVNHKDENRRNPSADNLEWCTAKYNQNYGTCIERRTKHTDFSNPAYRINAIRNSMARRRPVQQILNGIVVSEFASSAEASRATGILHINECCNNKRKAAGGYEWRFVKEE